MQTQADAEFNMMFALNNMDLNQEGSLSSEDRLFMPARTQPQQAQVNPFGVVKWEQGQAVYSPISQQPQVREDSQEHHSQLLLQQQQQQQMSMQQQQQQQYLEQQQMQQQMLLHQEQQMQLQQQMHLQHQIPPQNQQLFNPNPPQ
eukprot:GFUD01041661.1.p1 GENE.GFUD01041661.1~~GFUD01041661.1.p1  ORF type:complete len:145 (-),score=40.57 GFUD01041661.1:207-641(-)